MPKPIISIDIDDVIADATEALRLWANERTGHQLAKEQYRIDSEYWGYYEDVWHEAGIGHLIKLDDFQAELTIDQSRIEVISPAKEVLTQYKDRFRYILITSRDESQKAATVEWAKDRFGDLFEGIYFTGSKQSDGYKNKGELCANLGVRLHIDDNIDHCRSVIEQGVGGLMFGEYGWNQHRPNTITHCRNWKEVGEYFAQAKF